MGPLPAQLAADLARRLLDVEGAALSDAVDPVALTEIGREAGGSPFFVGELVRYLQRAPESEQPLPQGTPSLDAVLRDRLARLPDRARALLEDVQVLRRVRLVDAGEAAILESKGIQFSEDDNVLVQGVEGSPYAIGYFGYAYYQENQGALKAVSVDGVEPNAETAESGDYPISRPLFIYVNEEKAATNEALSKFVDFYLSAAGRDAVTEAGYVNIPDDECRIARRQAEQRIDAVDHIRGNSPPTLDVRSTVIVVENGQIVELSGGRIKMGERIPGGYIFVDGQSIGDVDYDIMREREKLARNGIFLIDISVDDLSGRLLHDPEIITRGFVSPEEAERLLPEVRHKIMDVVNDGGYDSEKDIANAVKSYLYEETKRRPMVLVTLSKG